MNKIIICGTNLLANNRGVQALGYGAIDVISMREKKVEYLVTFISPGKSQSNITENVSQKHLSKVDVLKLLVQKCVSLKNQEFNDSELFFSINEGDSYSDIYGFRRFFSIWIYNFVMRLLAKKMIFLPQTIGPFSNKFVETLAVMQLKEMDKIFVRDKISQTHLLKHSIHSTLLPDMAIFMSKEKPKNVKLPKKYVVINPSGLLYFGSHNLVNSSNYKKTLYETIEYLERNKYAIILLPHVYSTSEKFSSDDLSAAKEISKKYKKVMIIDRNLNAKECKYILGNAELVIAARMHACIGALSSNVPAIGMAYSYKFVGTFENFNMKKWVVDMKEAGNKTEQIIDLIKRYELNKIDIKNRLVKKNMLLQDKFIKLFKYGK